MILLKSGNQREILLFFLYSHYDYTLHTVMIKKYDLFISTGT